MDDLNTEDLFHPNRIGGSFDHGLDHRHFAYGHENASDELVREFLKYAE